MGGRGESQEAAQLGGDGEDTAIFRDNGEDVRPGGQGSVVIT
jgi:hypothetical protein